jgi:hypothetical protein
MIRATTGMSAICFAMVLGGCARSPYVRWQAPPEALKKDVPSDVAITYARDARAAYQTALGTEAQADAAVGASLITLSAVALGLGVADANRDALVGIGLLGGTAYSLRSWYRNKPAELAYLAGIKAIDCAIDAVQPYIDEEATQAKLDKNVNELRDLLPKAHAETARLDLVLKLSPDSTVKTTEVAVLSALGDTLKRADLQLAQGEGMLADLSGIGRALVQTVNNIGDKVDAAVHDNLPELSALPALIQNLASASSIVVPGLELKFNPATLKSPTFGTQGDEAVKNRQAREGASLDAIFHLIGEVSRIDAIGGEIANAYARVEGKKASDRMKECGVDAVVGMSVDPASITMTTPDSDAQIDIHIRNGKSPYWARLNGEGGSGVTVTSPIRGGSDFPVTIAKGAKGKVHAVVSDSAGHDINVPITINPKEQSSGGEATDKNKPTDQDVTKASDTNLQKVATAALAAGVNVQSVQVSFRATVSSSVLKLESDQYKQLKCTDQDALKAAVLQAKKSATDKTLKDQWTANGGGDLSAAGRLVFAGLCPAK